VIFGYARVSTSDQQLHLQTDALQAYGCAEVAQEKVSSVKERPALQYLLTRLRPSDTLVVWKLDRLGRSLKDLVTLVTGFQDNGVHFVSLQDHLDTTTAQGRLIFNLFASLAEFEPLSASALRPDSRRRGRGDDRVVGPKASLKKPCPRRKRPRRCTYSRTRPWPKSASCSAWAAPPSIATSRTWASPPAVMSGYPPKRSAELGSSSQLKCLCYLILGLIARCYCRRW
jgi:DNA invertase Pin-like site-specific DNA recombinase